MKIVHKQTDNGIIKEIIQEQNHFFVRVTEPNGEVTESQDFNTLERAKESIGIKPTITENNKLIAEFMNHKPTFEVYIDDVLTTLERPIKNYNSDWNDLMQVVEKIESLGYNVEISLFTCIIEPDDERDLFIQRGSVSLKKSKIETVYNACVKFVKEYNSFNQSVDTFMNGGQEKQK